MEALARRCTGSLASTSRPCWAAGGRGPRKLGEERRLICVARAVRPQHSFHHQDDTSYDLVLSSGFLAFANHSGFLQAVEEAELKVAGVMGTSAGALAGSLFCAGYSPQQVAAQLSRDPPIKLLRLCPQPWRGGVLTLDAVVERLRELLPPTFEDLDREFAVGVVNADGEHVLIDSGPLPEAVAASAAIPFIFANVDVPGGYGAQNNPFKDGGVVDRIGLKAWRDRRRRKMAAQGQKNMPPCLVHVISRSSPFSGFDDAPGTGEPNIHVVHSPKSGVNFFSLGDFDDAMNAALHRSRPTVQAVLARARNGGGSGIITGPTSLGGSASTSTSNGRRSPSPERKRAVAASRS